MRKITIYESNDGVKFDTESECIKYERLVFDVEKVMDSLILSNNRWSDPRHGYIQQDEKVVRETSFKILNMVSENCAIDNFFDLEGLSYAQRIVSEYSELRPLTYAVNRLCRIDEKGREFSQQYFRNHPEEVKLIELY